MEKVEVLVTVEMRPWLRNYPHGPISVGIVATWHVTGPSAEILELLRLHLGLHDWHVITNSPEQAELTYRQLHVVPSPEEVKEMTEAIIAGVRQVEKTIWEFRLRHKAAGLDRR